MTEFETKMIEALFAISGQLQGINLKLNDMNETLDNMELNMKTGILVFSNVGDWEYVR